QVPPGRLIGRKSEQLPIGRGPGPVSLGPADQVKVVKHERNRKRPGVQQNRHGPPQPGAGAMALQEGEWPVQEFHGQDYPGDTRDGNSQYYAGLKWLIASIRAQFESDWTAPGPWGR